MDVNCQKKYLKFFKSEENGHYPVGALYSYTQKMKALVNLQKDELTAVYNLIESHAPTLRFQASHQYEKSQSQNESLPLDINNFKFYCNNVNEGIGRILTQLQEMPKDKLPKGSQIKLSKFTSSQTISVPFTNFKDIPTLVDLLIYSLEWTIVQLTSKIDIKEFTNQNCENQTDALHLTILNCGPEQIPPFVMTLDPPYDHIGNKVIEIRKEIVSIINDNKNVYQNYKKLGKKVFSNFEEKSAYRDMRMAINNRLENLIDVITKKWLGVWRCLFIGKYTDEKIDQSITLKIREIFKTHKCKNASVKTEYLLRCVIKAAHILQPFERDAALKYLFPDESHKLLRDSLSSKIQIINQNQNLKQQFRQPVILIVDEKLDILPWEMIDVLREQPVSRTPSLHLTYALFKEHKQDIKHGYKIVKPNGNYIINPGLDLVQMEVRLQSFFNYWVPNWSGIVGIKPTPDDFQNALTSCDIFVYNGHGDGSQFLSSEKIKKMRVNGVVMLFGCSSVQLQSLGPQVEMFGPYQMYTIACSPCVVGMLWTVTDIDTDLLATELLSQLIKSNAKNHWKLVDKHIWEKDGKVTPTLKAGADKCNQHEPDLLKAIWNGKKAARQFLTRAACVARGIPVKVI